MIVPVPIPKVLIPHSSSCFCVASETFLIGFALFVFLIIGFAVSQNHDSEI